jgi:hypothetical protein
VPPVGTHQKVRQCNLTSCCGKWESFILPSLLGGLRGPEVFCPMDSGGFSFDVEFGEVKNAWSIASVSLLYLHGLVLKNLDTNYRQQYRYAMNASKLLAVIRAKTHLAPCCALPFDFNSICGVRFVATQNCCDSCME